MVVMLCLGVVVVIELLLVGVGDIDGMLVWVVGGLIEGVDFELIDIEYCVIVWMWIDFDGFFLFDWVVYG